MNFVVNAASYMAFKTRSNHKITQRL